jgi:beta-galactosidase GanA
MKPRIDDMVQDEPAKRPNVNEVVQRFEEIVQGLSQWKLHSQSHRQMLYFADKMRIPIRIISHWKRKMTYIMKRTPAIPSVS